MPLDAGDLNLRRGVPLSEYPAPLSEVLRSQSEQTRLENPTQALRRLRDLEEAEGRTERFEFDPQTGESEGGAVTGMGLRRRQSVLPPVERLDAETARTIVKEEGLPLTIPDDGISRQALDILMRRKRDELRRENVFSRGPSGIGAGAARLGVAFYESLFDPLNIASAFIPVVGEARYAALLARAAGAGGRAGVRAGVGAMEGAVGAALLEPLIYSAAAAEQADYTMADSLANIAFGGLFGGGLHAGGGAIRDIAQPGWWRIADAERNANEAAEIVRRVDFETRDAALRASVAQAAEGRQTEVAPIIRSDPASVTVYHGSPHTFERFDSSKIGTGEGHQAFGRGLYFAEKEAVAKTYAENVIPLRVIADSAHIAAAKDFIANGMDPESGLRAAYKDITESEIQAALIEARGSRAPSMYKVEIRREAVDRMLDWDKPLKDQPESVRAALESIENEMFRAWQKNGAWPHVTGQTIYRQLAGGLTNRAVAEGKDVAATNLLKEAGIPGIRFLDQGSRAGGEGTRNMVLFDDSLATIVERNGEPVRPADVVASAQKNAAPDAIRSAEPRASAASEQTARESKPVSAEAADAELESAMTAANDFAAALGEPERVKTGLEAYDKAIKRSDEYAKALRAGAACGIA